MAEFPMETLTSRLEYTRRKRRRARDKRTEAKVNEVAACYHGSNGERTRALYTRLLAEGPRGVIAINLMRTCKNSERAKIYKSRKSSGQAYDTKDWAIGQLCIALIQHGEALGIAWGWGRDRKAINFENVLYVDVPGSGQVSFHTAHRHAGPDYGKPWDRAIGTAPERIIRFASEVLGIEYQPPKKENDDGPRQDRTEGDAAAIPPRSEAREEGEQTALDL